MRFALAAALFAATIGTAPAAAQFFPPPFTQDRGGEQDIGRQLDDIYETIERARRSGRFSAPESRALHREGQQLFDRFQYMRRDGLDEWEYRELDERALALRERIERRLRFGDWRDQRDDGYRNGRRWDDRRWEDARDRKRDEDWRDSRADEGWREEDAPWADEVTGGGGDDPWRDEPTDPFPQAAEDWTVPSDTVRDDSRDATENNEPPADDWWLPPEERESIETRPGDRAPGIGDDGA